MKLAHYLKKKTSQNIYSLMDTRFLSTGNNIYKLDKEDKMFEGLDQYYIVLLQKIQ